jgi:hypothetical protein
LLPQLIAGLPATGPNRRRPPRSNTGEKEGTQMQSQSKPVAFNTRQVIFEMLALTGRAFAAGVAVSVVAAIIVVAIVTLVP